MLSTNAIYMEASLEVNIKAIYSRKLLTTKIILEQQQKKSVIVLFCKIVVLNLTHLLIDLCSRFCVCVCVCVIIMKEKEAIILRWSGRDKWDVGK